MKTILNYETPAERIKRKLSTNPIPTKRKFNLVAGLKRCYSDLNNYFGLETKGDKLFYYSCLGFMAFAGAFAIYARLTFIG